MSLCPLETVSFTWLVELLLLRLLNRFLLRFLMSQCWHPRTTLSFALSTPLPLAPIHCLSQTTLRFASPQPLPCTPDSHLTAYSTPPVECLKAAQTCPKAHSSSSRTMGSSHSLSPEQMLTPFLVAHVTRRGVMLGPSLSLSHSHLSKCCRGLKYVQDWITSYHLLSCPSGLKQRHLLAWVLATVF